MPKKVTICSNTLWSVLNFREELILAFLDKGYRVSVIGSDENIYEDAVTKLKRLNAEPIVVPVNRSGSNVFHEVVYFFRIFKVLKSQKPDLALFFSPKPNIYGSIACRLLNLPFINTITGLGSGIIRDNLMSAILRKMYSFSLKRSCKVLFQNAEDQTYFLDKKIIRKSIAGYVPGSGINTDKFDMPYKEKADKRTFIFASRLLKDKGVVEYINAVDEIRKESCPDAEFLLAGYVDKLNPSGITSKEIEGWERHRIIRYIGRTDNIMDFFALADIIVLPSYREGLSRILLEAASCRKVIVTTDVPGCREIVEDGFNGFLCKPKDVTSLKTALKKAIDLSDDDVRLYGANGRQKVIKRFSHELANKEYLELTDTILKNK